MSDETPQVVGIVLEEVHLTLVEVSRACAVHAECIVELVEEGVLVPSGTEPRQWRFGGEQLRRANAALRLQRDLGVNVAGVALILELLDEIEDLRRRLRALGGDV